MRNRRQRFCVGTLTALCVEEYHKILKSGTQAESYRLAATSMEAILGFLTVIAAELLRVTYLHRTQPDAPATTVLSSVQLNVLKALVSQIAESVYRAMGS